MAQGKEQVRIKLTPEQRDQIRRATGKSAESLELTVEELEQRIAPSMLTGRSDGSGGGNVS